MEIWAIFPIMNAVLYTAKYAKFLQVLTPHFFYR